MKNTGHARLAHACCIVCVSIGSLVVGQAQSRPIALPVADGVASALREHPIVCLGEGTHRGVEELDLRLALLRSSAVQSLVTDVVVEFGNARYQPLMDRFVQGDAVDEAELRRVWEDAVPADTVADSPVYERLYRGIRDINVTLPAERRFRVLLGDPPIDWNTVHTAADLLQWGSQRDTHVASLISREVLAKGRRALALYGAWHCATRNEFTDFTTADSLRAILDQQHPGAVFSIRVFGREDTDPRTLEPAMAAWSVPSFSRLSGTTLGLVDFAAVNALDGRTVTRDGIRTPIPREQWTKRSLNEQFEAVVYLGPPSSLTTARIDLAHCKDARYLAMRTARMALTLGITPTVAGGGDPVAQLRQYCATLVGQGTP